MAYSSLTSKYALATQLASHTASMVAQTGFASLIPVERSRG